MAMRDEEDMDNTRDTTGLITGSPRSQDSGKDTQEGMPFCGCLSMKYYQVSTLLSSLLSPPGLSSLVHMCMYVPY